jgi:hypothetical protein
VLVRASRTWIGSLDWWWAVCETVTPSGLAVVFSLRASRCLQIRTVPRLFGSVALKNRNRSRTSKFTYQKIKTEPNNRKIDISVRFRFQFGVRFSV